MFFDDIGILDCNEGMCMEFLYVVMKLINIMVENLIIFLRMFVC